MFYDTPRIVHLRRGHLSFRPTNFRYIFLQPSHATLPSMVPKMPAMETDVPYNLLVSLQMLFTSQHMLSHNVFKGTNRSCTTSTFSRLLG